MRKSFISTDDTRALYGIAKFLMGSDQLFARKFSEKVDRQKVERICELLKQDD